MITKLKEIQNLTYNDLIVLGHHRRSLEIDENSHVKLEKNI